MITRDARTFKGIVLGLVFLILTLASFYLARLLWNRYSFLLARGRIPEVRELKDYRKLPDFYLLILRKWHKLTLYRVKGGEGERVSDITSLPVVFVPERAFKLKSGLVILGLSKDGVRKLLLVPFDKDLSFSSCFPVRGLERLKVRDLVSGRGELGVVGYLNGRPTFLLGKIEGDKFQITRRFDLNISCRPKRASFSGKVLALSCGNSIYLFLMKENKLVKSDELRPEGDVRYVFPAFSPEGDKLAFIELRGKDYFNLVVADLVYTNGKVSVSSLRKISHLPPKTIVGMTPIFLSDKDVVVSSDFKKNFKVYVVNLDRSGVWYDLGLPSDVMQWPVGIWMEN